MTGQPARSRFQIQRSVAHALWYLHDAHTNVTEAHFSWEACWQRAAILGHPDNGLTVTRDLGSSQNSGAARASPRPLIA